MMNLIRFKENAACSMRRVHSRSAAIVLWLGAMSALCALGSAASAFAQNLEPVQVYATLGAADTGPQGALAITDLPNGESQEIYLWAQGGDERSTGPVCTTEGTGSPLCGISFTLSTKGGYEMLSFQPNSSFDGSANVKFLTTMPSPEKLVGNAFDLGTPTVENRYLGKLFLRANRANGDSRIEVSGAAIGADLTMRDIAPEPVVVPEPDAVLMLSFGVLGLARLRGRRRRSESERPRRL